VVDQAAVYAAKTRAAHVDETFFPSGEHVEAAIDSTLDPQAAAEVTSCAQVDQSTAMSSRSVESTPFATSLKVPSPPTATIKR